MRFLVIFAVAVMTFGANPALAAQQSANPPAASTDKKTPFVIDFTKPLIGVSGEAIWNPGADCVSQIPDKPQPVPGKTCSKENVTLGDAAVGALEATLQSDQNEDPLKKFKRDQLARKIYKQKSIVLSSEEITEIKDRIGKAYGAAIVGAAWPMIDPSLQ
jgi:hypothetical protein